MAVTALDAKARRAWARALVTDAMYLYRMHRRLARGEAPHLERFFLRHLSTPSRQQLVKLTGGFRVRAILYEQNPDLPPPPGPSDPFVERARNPNTLRPLSALEKEATTPGLDVMRAALDATRYQLGVRRRLRAGTLSRAHELDLWKLAYGGPGEMRSEVNRPLEIWLLGDLHDPMARDGEPRCAEPARRHPDRGGPPPPARPTFVDETGEELEMLTDE